MILIDWLHEFDPMESQAELRGALGQILFNGEDAVKRTEALSDGEAARLALCRLMLEKPNVLLLDEPTNHLAEYHGRPPFPERTWPSLASLQMTGYETQQSVYIVR